MHNEIRQSFDVTENGNIKILLANRNIRIYKIRLHSLFFLYFYKWILKLEFDSKFVYFKTIIFKLG